MSLKPVFQNRDFTNKADNHRLAWKVGELAWESVGGCSQATIGVSGPELDLWELVEYLRCPVVIQDEIARPAWWGYVSEVRVQVGAIQIGVTIDSMTNRVAVVYTYIVPGTELTGQRKTTAWAQDNDSVAEYGTRERVFSASGLSDAGALAMRDTILAAQKLPAGVTTQNFGYVRGNIRNQGNNSQTATLICTGWFETLDWQYAVWGSVTGPNYQGNTASRYIGDLSTSEKLLQQFTVGNAAINILSIQIGARKFAAPADNLKFDIFELDSSGNPTGSALTGGSIAGGSLTTTVALYTLSVTEHELAANTKYGIVVSRSGGLDATNYYSAAIGPDTYTGGVFKAWNGSVWTVESRDLYFVMSVNNNVESTSQVNDLANNYGEFIIGVDIDTASGVSSPSYRIGDTTTLEEIKALLAIGGPNKRRYLAEVDQNRRLHLWEEPAMIETYYLNRWGELSDGHLPVIAWMPPVGIWARLRDVIPASADTSKLTDPTLQFIEAATWSPDNGLSFRFRGQKSIDDIMRMK